METGHRLELRKETLTELTDDELYAVVGLTGICVTTWSVDYQTRICPTCEPTCTAISLTTFLGC